MEGTPSLADVGDYAIEITVSDGELSDTLSFMLSVLPPPNLPPVAGFIWTSDYLEVSFTNTSFDEDGDSLSHSWDFGDGNNSTDENPFHFYTTEGSYNVVLTVNDGFVEDSYSDTIEVVQPIQTISLSSNWNLSLIHI